MLHATFGRLRQAAVPGTPEQVFAYLSRYTHRICIGNSRILAFDGAHVRVRCRKPKRPGQRKPRYGAITLAAEAFIDRFLMHVLPPGMQRIRHFGILANSCRAETLKQARDALGVADIPSSDRNAEGRDGGEDDRDRDEDVAPVACPHCGGILRKIEAIPRPRRTAHASRDPPHATSVEEMAT